MTAMQTFQELSMRRRHVTSVALLAVGSGGIVPWKLTAREACAQSGSAAARALTTAGGQISDQQIDEKAPGDAPARPVKKPLLPPGMVETPPTPQTLEKWLDDKEWIEISFGGPHMNPLELRDSMVSTNLPIRELPVFPCLALCSALPSDDSLTYAADYGR
jgi:hypothetical protein